MNRASDSPSGKEAHLGSPWLKELYDLFAPVRQEAVAAEMSEAEINAAIDAAVRAVRRRDACRARSNPGPGEGQGSVRHD